MLSSTRASSPPETTWSGSKGNTSQYTSDRPPPAEHVCFNQEQVGKRFGWVEIISPERRYTRGWTTLYVLVRCTGCKRENWAHYANLTRGKSRGCQRCSTPRAVPLWLDRRLTAAKSRCENPADPGYRNYGARGVEFRFSSVTEAGLYVLANLGLDRGKEIDRVDNNGHYEPGNLKWSTRSQQSRNTRRSKLTQEDEDWARHKSPYSVFTSRKMLRMGLSREEVIDAARNAVRETRKNWMGIALKLRELGYSTS